MSTDTRPACLQPACPGKMRGYAACIAQAAYPLKGFSFSIKRWFFSFKAVFYLALMLTTVLKAELAVLFTLLMAFTL